MISPDKVLFKIKRYCAYQERCLLEVKTKLLSYDINLDEIDNILMKLTQEGFINENRFAKSFAGGKFRNKHWGRLKIRSELKLRNLSDQCIAEGLTEIDADSYDRVLDKLITRKWQQLTKETHQKKKEKVFRYAQSKGYEMEIIQKKMTTLEVT